MATTHFGGGGLVRAQTTVRQTPFPWQPCPGRQPPAGSEIPLERIVTVGLMPFHLLVVQSSRPKNTKKNKQTVFTENGPQKSKALIVPDQIPAFKLTPYTLCTHSPIIKVSSGTPPSASRKTETNLLTWPMKLNMGPKLSQRTENTLLKV